MMLKRRNLKQTGGQKCSSFNINNTATFKAVMNNKYYTYAYLREDRSPYYIGKGKNTRAYDRHQKGICVPKDKSRIIFLKQNLTEEEAFKHEKYMIAVFGRKDLGTGILHNRTDGGEGSCNMSEKGRNTLRQYHTGKKLSENTKQKIRLANLGKKYPEETKNKLSEMRRGKNNPFYGKKHNEETKEKISKANKGRKLSPEIIKKMIENRTPGGLKNIEKTQFMVKKYKIVFNNGNEIVIDGLKKWSEENNYSRTCLYKILNQKWRYYRDIISVECID